jgi:hypothetical protein
VSKDDFKLNRHAGREKVVQAIYSPKSFRIANTSGIAGLPAKMFLIAAIAIAFIYGIRNHITYESSPAAALPDNGSIIQYKQVDPSLPVAPFKVITDPQATTTYYLVLASDWNTSLPVVAMFVFGGREAETLLPVGEYKISIAKGSTWYGIGHLFGSKTEFTQGTKPISLYQAAPQRTVGATIDLRKKSNGNFPVVQGGLITRQ